MKKIKAIIFHGTGGSPDGNWFPWLADQLRAHDLDVTVPKFPTPQGQSLDNWTAAFKEQVGPLTDDMILIGHSMGVGMILRLLESCETPVQATFLISGWDGLLGSPDFDPLIESFYTKPFNYPMIKKNLGRAHMYHGDDDPYVPLNMAKDLASNLDVELQVVLEGGHLNTETGYTTFPQLFDDINKVICSTK